MNGDGLPSGSLKTKVRPNGVSNGFTRIGTPCALRWSCSAWASSACSDTDTLSPNAGELRPGAHQGPVPGPAEFHPPPAGAAAPDRRFDALADRRSIGGVKVRIIEA